MTNTTPSAPLHAALITTLHTHGWATTGPEDSALITGLSTTTLTAPVGELTVPVEAVGAIAVLTLSANPPEGVTETGRYYAAWQAVAPVLSERELDKLARASEGARVGEEPGADADELIRQLKPKSWKHTEEYSCDELFCSRLTSPDATRQISWGADEESWRIAHRSEQSVITADGATPITVLRVMAGLD